jgi:hypothetical protein
MKMSSAFAPRFALTVFAGTMPPASQADEGFVTLTIYKAGWIIGGSGGGGVLNSTAAATALDRRTDYGLVFGGSKTCRAAASATSTVPDVAAHGAAGAGLAIARRVRSC